ncbi:MAG TPA: DsbA family protein [Caulobacteraceae bacterium]|nr:DsbA family protein [Caulobacteraceae bacterium]
MTGARPDRRAALAGALSLVVVLAGASAKAAPAAPMAPEPGDMALGQAGAPVTVIEYASVGCPHCAEWANVVFPAFKARYLDTGRARFVMREMITGDPTLATAGFMLARCAGPAKYFAVVDAIFRRQASMYQPPNTPGAVLEDIARSVGVDAAAFRACMENQAGLDALDERTRRHATVDKVDSTPTFFVNGRRLEGAIGLDELAQAIGAAARRP